MKSVTGPSLGKHVSCCGAMGRPLAIGRGHSIFRLRNISRAQLPRKERRTDTKIEKFYAMVNHNLEFLETSSRIWCCLAGARQQIPTLFSYPFVFFVDGLPVMKMTALLCGNFLLEGQAF